MGLFENNGNNEASQEQIQKLSAMVADLQKSNTEFKRRLELDELKLFELERHINSISMDINRLEQSVCQIARQSNCYHW